MDEAERCHALAILDRGVLVASGAPRALMDALAGNVVEIEGEGLRAARGALEALPSVVSVAQLGTRLRVLMNETAEPVQTLQQALDAARVPARFATSRSETASKPRALKAAAAAARRSARTSGAVARARGRPTRRGCARRLGVSAGLAMARI